MLLRVRYRWRCVVLALWAYFWTGVLHICPSPEGLMSSAAYTPFALISLCASAYLLYTASIPWAEYVAPYVKQQTSLQWSDTLDRAEDARIQQNLHELHHYRMNEF